MAQNLFAYEEDIGIPAKLKKKKKKIVTKKLFDKEKDKGNLDNNLPAYLIEDDLFGIDIMDQPSTTILKPTSSNKKGSSLRKKK